MPYISLRILDIMRENIESAERNQLNKDDATYTPVEPKKVTHASGDDLESLFYIFFECVTKYAGARGVVAPAWDKQPVPWSRVYEALCGSDGLTSAFYSKKGAMATSQLWTKNITKYFKQLQPIIEEWRLLIWSTVDGNGGTKQEINHDIIREMLEKFIRTYDNESPYLPPPSLPPGPPSSHTTTGSPTFQSTHQSTGGSGSSTRPPQRRSLRLKEKSR